MTNAAQLQSIRAGTQRLAPALPLSPLSLYPCLWIEVDSPAREHVCVHVTRGLLGKEGWSFAWRGPTSQKYYFLTGPLHVYCR